MTGATQELRILTGSAWAVGMPKQRDGEAGSSNFNDA